MGPEMGAERLDPFAPDTGATLELLSHTFVCSLSTAFPDLAQLQLAPRLHERALSHLDRMLWSADLQ